MISMFVHMYCMYVHMYAVKMRAHLHFPLTYASAMCKEVLNRGRGEGRGHRNKVVNGVGVGGEGVMR